MGCGARGVDVKEEVVLVSGEVKNVSPGLHVHVSTVAAPCAIGASPLLVRSPVECNALVSTLAFSHKASDELSRT